MVAPTRLALFVFGLAAIVYGTASLTGGWLGTPPWSCMQSVTDEEVESAPLTQSEIAEVFLGTKTKPVVSYGPGPLPWQTHRLNDLVRARLLRGRWPAWPGAALLTAGLALATFGAWPRRSRSRRVS